MSISADANGFRLPGSVSFDNFTDVRTAGEHAISENGNECVLSLSGLGQSNSIAVALLVAWFRFANSHGKSIVYVDVPEDLRNIIEVSGLTEVLHLR